MIVTGRGIKVGSRDCCDSPTILLRVERHDVSLPTLLSTGSIFIENPLWRNTFRHGNGDLLDRRNWATFAASSSDFPALWMPVITAGKSWSRDNLAVISFVRVLDAFFNRDERNVIPLRCNRKLRLLAVQLFLRPFPSSAKLSLSMVIWGMVYSKVIISLILTTNQFVALFFVSLSYQFPYNIVWKKGSSIFFIYSF